MIRKKITMSQKRNTLTLKRKVDLILYTETNPSKKRSEIAREFGILPSGVTGIMREKQKYKQLYFSGQADALTCKLRPAKHRSVDSALIKWVIDARSAGRDVNGLILTAKAEEIARQLGILDWTCTRGWLHRFKRRYNITFRQKSNDGQTSKRKSNSWTENVFKPVLHRYDPKDVFSADETVVFWRQLPESTNTTEGLFSEECAGSKRSKDRVTVVVCANMDGSEKRPLLVIGKSGHPRCFKQMTLPVQYDYDEKVQMTSDLFNDWLKGFDRSMSKQSRNVLLVISNCAAHAKAQAPLLATQLLYLPPNDAPRRQPFGQGIVQNLKFEYRRLSLEKLNEHTDSGAVAENFKMTLYDALAMLKHAWDNVTSTTILEGFRKAGFSDQETSALPEEDNNGDSASACVGAEDCASATAAEIKTAPVSFANTPASSTSSSVGSLECQCENDKRSPEEESVQNEERITQSKAQECLCKIDLFLKQSGCTDAVLAPFLQFRQAFDQHVLSPVTSEFPVKIEIERDVDLGPGHARESQKLWGDVDLSPVVKQEPMDDCSATDERQAQEGERQVDELDAGQRWEVKTEEGEVWEVKTVQGAKWEASVQDMRPAQENEAERGDERELQTAILES